MKAERWHGIVLMCTVGSGRGCMVCACVVERVLKERADLAQDGGARATQIIENEFLWYKALFFDLVSGPVPHKGQLQLSVCSRIREDVFDEVFAQVAIPHNAHSLPAQCCSCITHNSPLEITLSNICTILIVLYCTPKIHSDVI